MVANVPPTPTLYLDTPPTPGRYCYSVSAQGTVHGVASTSPLAQPFLVVTVGGPLFPGPQAVQAEGLVPRSAIQSLVADSVESSNPTRFAVANALDGDPATFWHTPFTGTIPPYPHTLTLDLGQEWALAGARVWPRPDGGGGFVTQWRIEVSSDGATWTVAGTSPVRTLTTQPEAVRWPVRRARYVRLVCLRGVSGQGFASIGEFQLLQGVAP
jgi:hypothetical protein